MQAFNGAKRFRFPFRESEIGIYNGIYALFEKNELLDGYDRITRIGINREQGNFVSRLEDHFMGDNQRNSIFRKHYGRCLLHLRGDAYLKYWNCGFKKVEDKKKYAGLVNLQYEIPIEKEISTYIQSNCSFVVIELNDSARRKQLESALIASISQSGRNTPSQSWMGNSHPDYPFFQQTGLWNVQGRTGTGLNESDFNLIQSKLVK